MVVAFLSCAAKNILFYFNPATHLVLFMSLNAEEIVYSSVDLSQSSNSLSKQSDAPKLRLSHYNWSLVERHRKESIFPKACEIVTQIGTQLQRLPPIKGG